MKKLFSTIITIVCFLVMVSFSFAGTNVTFQWDPNTEADLSGYKIYRSGTSRTYGTEPILTVTCGPNDESCCTATNENVEDGTWFWVATAYDNNGNESEYSNEVTDTFDVTAPEAPNNFSIWKKIVSWFRNLFGHKNLKIG